MEQKDIKTNDSLVEQEEGSLKYLKFFKEEREPEKILRHLLKNYDEEQDDPRNKMARIRNILQEQLDNFHAAEKEHFQKYFISDRLKVYLQFLCGNQIHTRINDKVAHLTVMKQTYIGYLETKTDELLKKIQQWRQQMKRIEERKNKQSRANRLIFKAYNLKNYIEQLQLVKDLVNRVENILKSEVPDIRHVEELSLKKTVPYNFYSDFCLNNCCRIISKRIETEHLVMLIHSTANLQLLERMASFFFKSKKLNQKCSILLKLCKYVRITNSKILAVDNGFILYFKPFFLESLQENADIDSIEFLKARSIMQNQEETIDLWQQFEDLKVEVYCLWFYEQLQLIKMQQTVQLQKVKNILKDYRMKYNWIEHSKISKLQLRHKQAFPTTCIGIVIIKVLKPLLLQLYYHKISPQSQTLFQKFKRQYNNYWLYWLFHKYRMLFDFIKDLLSYAIINFNQKEANTIFDQNQLNIEQYYSYYRQIAELIQVELGQNLLATEFEQFWKELVVKFSESLSRAKPKIDIGRNLQDQYQALQFYNRQERKLQALLQGKKKRQSFKEEVYSCLMKLHFNTANYFLLQEAIKALGKDTEKQISLIREVAYSQFYP